MKLILLLAFVVAVSNLANASPSCADFERVIAAAPDGFKSLRAREVTKDAYVSGFQMPGAGPCMIGAAADEALFACRLPFVSRAGAQIAYEAEVANARACFPNWPTKAAEDVPSDQFTAAQGIRLLGPGGVGVGVMQFHEKNGLLNIEWVAVSVFWHQPPSIS